MSLIGTNPNQLPAAGMLGTMAWQDRAAVQIEGGRSAAQVHRRPWVRSASFTVAEGESAFLITAAAAVVVTLPDPALNMGREIRLVNLGNGTTAGAITSASANVVPLLGGAASAAILPASPGAWVMLASDGTLWQAVAGSPSTAVVPGQWRGFPGVTMRLRMTGTGTVTMDSRDAAGNVSSAVYTASVAGAELVDYAYPGDNAVQIRITFTGSAAAEVI